MRKGRWTAWVIPASSEARAERILSLGLVAPAKRCWGDSATRCSQCVWFPIRTYSMTFLKPSIASYSSPFPQSLARLSAHSSPPLASIHVFKMGWIFWLSINIASTRHPQSSLLFISLSSARPTLVTSGKQSYVSVRAFLSMVTIPSLIPQMGYCGKTQSLWSESSNFQWPDLKAHCKPMMIQAGGPGSKPSQSKEQSMKCTTGSVYVTTECTAKWREWF